MSEQITAIGSFGEQVGSSALFGAEIDTAMHTDADGNVQSVFPPEEPVYFLLYHAANVVVKRVLATDGGDIQRIGEVTRGVVQRVIFQHPEHSVELSHQPIATPAAAWFGRESGLVLTGKSVVAAGAPCQGDLSYQFKAVQYMHRIVNGFTLTEDGQWPCAAIIEYEVV